jgi:protein disulfide-isomerase A6
MKPTWNKLGAEYDGHSSVLIGDVDCTVHQDLCQRFGVNGYPTIKYFNSETGEDGEKYQSGRDYDSLKAHVVEHLEAGCSVEEPEDCTEKEQKYIKKMQASPDKVPKQLTRLEGMAKKKMAPNLKEWVNQRINILKQLA